MLADLTVRFVVELLVRQAHTDGRAESPLHRLHPGYEGCELRRRRTWLPFTHVRVTSAQ